MTDLIIIAILAVAVLLGIRSGVKHFKGEGGCCGGGTYKPRKKKLASVAGKKTLLIEGMTCQRCENRVHEAINRIHGASAQVSHQRGRAVVEMEQLISDEALKDAVEKAGYHVTAIR